MQKRPLEKVLWLLEQKRCAIVVLQGDTRPDKNDPNFLERDKVKHRTGCLTDQSVGRIQVRHNVVIVHRDQHGMRILLDGTFVEGMVPVRGIFPTPAIMMQLNDQVIPGRLSKDMFAEQVDARRFVGRCKQDSGLRGIEAKPLENRLPGGQPRPEERVEFG
jgi:hypothetical protein